MTASSREGVPHSELVSILLRWLTSFRLLDEEAASPEGLRPSASFQEVTRWLQSLWLRLSAVEISELPAHKRSVMVEILKSNLRRPEQAHALTALDYLTRLSAARRVANVEGLTGQVALPPSSHPDMQAAYRRLAGFAPSDLPIWLIGERGTELEELARAVHKLRGLPDSSFHVWNAAGAERRTEIPIVMDDARPGETTVFVQAVEEAPPFVHQQLYDCMVRDFLKRGLFRVVIGTGPVELEDGTYSNLLTEIFAFLSPTSVRVPPLRSRREDLPGLMRFLAQAMQLTDPVPRITNETMELLKQYHWPGNTQELKWVTGFMLKKRPAGAIRPSDLPDPIWPGTTSKIPLTSVLRDLGAQNRFRSLGSMEQCRTLANFLTARRNTRFTPSDVQCLIPMGRETARRLLQALENAGLIVGLTGAGNRRVTGYRYVSASREEGDSDGTA
jgi:hypothetical protein